MSDIVMTCIAAMVGGMIGGALYQMAKAKLFTATILPRERFTAVVYETHGGTWNWAIISPGAPYGNAPTKEAAKAEANSHSANGQRYQLEIVEV